jgi:hypothetical protein
VRHQNVFPLLGFAIALGFLVVRVEEAKQQQLRLIKELDGTMNDLHYDAENLTSIIAERKRRLAIKPEILSIRKQFIPHSDRITLDSTGVYKKYIEGRYKLDQLENTLEALPVLERGWKPIPVLEKRRDVYVVNEWIEDHLRILFVPTWLKPEEFQINVNGSVDERTEFPIVSAEKLKNIEVIWTNSKIKEPRVYKTQFE